MDENTRVGGNIIIENRKKFTLSGIKDVLAFDEETISLESSLGKLVIKGIGLRIESFLADSGDLSGVGKVNAVVYTAEMQGGGFFSKLFR